MCTRGINGVRGPREGVPQSYLRAAAEAKQGTTAAIPISNDLLNAYSNSNNNYGSSSTTPLFYKIDGIGAATWAKQWSIAIAGSGRASWAMGDATAAEAALSEANVLDNQNACVWGWLAFVCMSAEPLRDKEASVALDQAIKLGLAGDCTETTVLLHLLADTYKALGQIPTTIALLRRASLRAASTISASHMDAVLQVKFGLGQALEEVGRLEEAEKELLANHKATVAAIAKLEPLSVSTATGGPATVSPNLMASLTALANTAQRTLGALQRRLGTN